MYKKILSYDTTQKSEFRSITTDLRACVAEAGVENGTLLAYSLHTTLGLLIRPMRSISLIHWRGLSTAASCRPSLLFEP